MYKMVLPPAGDNRSSAGERIQGLHPSSHPTSSGLLPFYSQQTGAQRAEMTDKEGWLTYSITLHLVTNSRYPLDALPLVNTFPGVLGDLGLQKPLPIRRKRGNGSFYLWRGTARLYCPRASAVLPSTPASLISPSLPAPPPSFLGLPRSQPRPHP